MLQLSALGGVIINITLLSSVYLFAMKTSFSTISPYFDFWDRLACFGGAQLGGAPGCL